MSLASGRRMPTGRCSLLVVLALSTSATATAFAQPSPKTVTESATASDSAEVVVPAPGQAAAAPPSRTAIPITATCSLGDHPGVDADEARVAADIVCHELARRAATNTEHEVRFGKLGGRTMVTLASHKGNVYDERRTFVTGLDEVNVAGPRLAAALVEGKPLDETRTTDNVLSSEASQPRVQRGASTFDGGLFGTTALGTTSGVSGGVDIGFLYRAGNVGIGAHGRAGGIGSSDDKVSLATLDVGGRVYLASGDVAPFLGAGLGVSHFSVSRSKATDLDGAGVGAYAQLGLEVLRTHHMALSTSLRLDAPFFALEGTGASQYVAPLSLNVGFLMH